MSSQVWRVGKRGKGAGEKGEKGGRGRKEAWSRFSLRASGRNQPCQHLGFWNCETVSFRCFSATQFAVCVTAATGSEHTAPSSQGGPYSDPEGRCMTGLSTVPGTFQRSTPEISAVTVAVSH